MTHVIEPASTGRAKCRGCGEKIARGKLRFGERGPNPFGDGDATYWFHPTCAACRRPEILSKSACSFHVAVLPSGALRVRPKSEA